MGGTKPPVDEPVKFPSLSDELKNDPKEEVIFYTKGGEPDETQAEHAAVVGDYSSKPGRKVMTITENSVNIRLQPNLKGQVIAHINSGQEVLTEGEPEGEGNDWQPVVVFVNKKYLK